MRHPRRRAADPLPEPGQVAQTIGPRLLARVDGHGSTDEPFDPPGGDTRRAGGPHSGVAEGALRVGREPVPEPGPQPVAGGEDRPGGRYQAEGRGAAGKGAAVPRFPVRHPPRRRRQAEGPDATSEGPLRRHPGQARQPGLPAKGGAAVHPAPGAQRRGGVAHAGHLQPGEAVPLLAAGPGYPLRHPLRHRPAGLRPHRLRPPRRDAPERQHRCLGPLRLRESPSPPSWASCGACAGECGPT